MKSNPFATLAYGAMTLLVAFYIAFVALLMHHDAMPIPVFAGIAFAALAALLLGAKACRTVKLDVAERADRPNRRVFLLAAGFSALVYAVYLVAYFPGGFSSDTVYQWRQIQGVMPYTDCTRAAHPDDGCAAQARRSSRVRAGRAGSFAMRLPVGYTADVLGAVGAIPKWVILVITAYLSLNPSISNIMLFPWKDCAFAIAALFLGAQLLDVHFSQGESLSPARCLALGATLSLCAILRHNGMAMALAAGAWLLIALPQRWKRVLPALLIAVLMTLGHSRAAVSGFWHRAPAHAAGRDVRRSDDAPGQHL